MKNVPTTPIDVESDAGVTTPNSATPPPACTAGDRDLENLDESLKTCEVPVPRSADVSPIKDKLEVKVTPSAAQVAPGGKLDVVVSLRNKSPEAVVVYFAGEPGPRFDIETWDAKGKRVDIPATRFPGFPKGYKPDPRETKAARITIEKNATARLKLSWDAVKSKWAPDRARTWEGRGFPRVPAGPLPPGKYQLKVIIPVVGELDVPKAPVDIGG